MTSPTPPTVSDLRGIKGRVLDLIRTSDGDLRTYFNKSHPNTFRHTPKAIGADLDVATTATALMAVALATELGFKTKGVNAHAGLRTTFESPEWGSAGLKEGNWFTRALVLRAAGFLAQPGITEQLRHPPGAGVTTSDMLDEFFSGRPDKTMVGGKSKYPLTPAIAYWVTDASVRLGYSVDTDNWTRWMQWATREFNRQYSLVAASDDAQMDPLALAMSACLVQVMRELKTRTAIPQSLQDIPARELLEDAVRKVFACQGASGSWPKYFPLFIYPNGSAVNHLFAFEMLESVIAEFPDVVLSDANTFGRLLLSIDWCRVQRIPSYSRDELTWSGWNSGADLQTVRERRPEGWATAAIRMFLFVALRALNLRIRDLLLLEYNADIPRPDLAEKYSKDWAELAENYVVFTGESEVPIKALLSEDMVNPWILKTVPANREKRSALLFGPPGTSKTTLVKRLAMKSDRPFIAIDPVSFLQDGPEKIYQRVTRVFRDLADMPQTIVLFDELDPLVLEREQESDVTHQFLTTALLPKLADLRQGSDVVFFMATNHFDWFDPAIKRPGRFDFHICVGPPRSRPKLQSILSGEKDELGSEEDKAQALPVLMEWCKAKEMTDKLDLFTHGETRALLESLVRGGKTLLQVVREDQAQRRFADTVDAWSRENIVLWRRKVEGTIDAASRAYIEYFGPEGVTDTVPPLGDIAKSKRQ
jgi:hypothetical protein